jgi:hypothetical protein
MTPGTHLVLFLALQTPAQVAGHVEYSYAYGKRFAFTIKEPDIAMAPAWKADSENPPLSPRKALRVASDKLKELVPNTTNWTLKSLNLRPWQEDGSRWYCGAVFEANPRREKSSDLFTSDGNPRSIRIPVLMNGASAVPVISPMSDQ